MSAKYAMFLYDLGVMILDIDGLDRALTQTPVAVLTLYRLEFQVL
jgi:hypothetical protein